MPTARELIHSCDLYRPATVKTATGQGKASLPSTPTAAGVKCLLQPRATKHVRELFGADVQCDGVVYFSHGRDVRPGVEQTNGLNDRLVITAHGVETSWLVVGVREVHEARSGYVVAAVKRSAT